jgi:serine/threonine protein kinase
MRTKYLTGMLIIVKVHYFYRDIKPENFLLKHKDDISNIKMIDFGLSKDYSETKVMQTPSGSVSYLIS